MVEIEIRGLNKSFLVSHDKSNTLVEQVISSFSFRQKKISETFWALKNINLRIKKGECVGIIGRNGSGKSTLLKIIAGIIRPSSGRVNVWGNVLPFIELGAGFNSELTGKENIFLYGTLLGLSKEKIREKYEQTVDFANLGDFIDAKLKTYSSGMQARLSFSTALMIEPDIILIDEVLSVGDSSFQEKCINQIREFKKEKKTIVFVSHSAEQVREICDRSILLDKGEILMAGKTEEVLQFYKCKIFEEDRLDFQNQIRINSERIFSLKEKEKDLNKKIKLSKKRIEKIHFLTQIKSVRKQASSLKKSNDSYYTDLMSRIAIQISEYQRFIEAYQNKKNSKSENKKVAIVKEFLNKLVAEENKITYNNISSGKQDKIILKEKINDFSLINIKNRTLFAEEAKKGISNLNSKELSRLKIKLKEEIKRTDDLSQKIMLTRLIKMIILEEMKK
jgi:ABC-type polysaccharide/polyol phosphate transport system ATPase subunit